MDAEVYAVVDKDGNIVNTVLWDGEADWQPGDGLVAVHCGENRCSIGGRYEDGVFYDLLSPNPTN